MRQAVVGRGLQVAAPACSSWYPGGHRGIESPAPLRRARHLRSSLVPQLAGITRGLPKQHVKQLHAAQHKSCDTALGIAATEPATTSLECASHGFLPAEAAGQLPLQPRIGLWQAAGGTASTMALACRSLLAVTASRVAGYAASTAMAAALLALNLAACGSASAAAIPAPQPIVSVVLQQQQQQPASLNAGTAMHGFRPVPASAILSSRSQPWATVSQPTSAVVGAEAGISLDWADFGAGSASVSSGAQPPVVSSHASWQQQEWQGQGLQERTEAGAAAQSLASAALQELATSSGQMAVTEQRSDNFPTHLGMYRFEIASEAEDKLLELVRQVETRVGSAVGSVTSILEGAEDSIQAAATARTLINEVWEVVDQNYLDARSTGFDRAKWAQLRDNALSQQYSSTAAAYRAVREMMAWGLSDPYCRFIPPSELAAMKKYDVTGVGLNLGTADEFVRKTGRQLPRTWRTGDEGIFVVGISKGSASEVAGMQQGDQLIKVDGKSLVGVSPFQAASLIQGESEDAAQGSLASALGAQQQPPSSVSLQVRKPDGAVADVRLERPVKTTPTPVTSRLVKAGMLRPEPTGLLRLTSFNARAHRDLEQAITQLEAAGAQSLVLDLRDNRGGLVSEGLEVARLFLGQGQPIVITESRAGRSEPLPEPTAAAPSESAGPGSAMAAAMPQPPPAPPVPASVDTIPMAEGQPRTELPLTLLVNDHTASAAEIVAGALKDNCRAVLVGGQTYGKGLIQSVYELSDGSGMVVTVGKYLTPSRIDIDRYGIRPNFSSQPTSEQFTQTLDACRISKEHDVLVEFANQYVQRQSQSQARRS